MTRISSQRTWFLKKAFPVLLVGFLAIFVPIVIRRGKQQDLVFLVFPAFMAVFAFFLMKKLVWDLADEVYDCGDSLLVKNRGQEDRVEFSNIMNVSSSMLVNPPRITLRLVNVSKFGNEISFSPARGFTLNPFAKDRVSENLMVRAWEARTRR